MSTRPLSICIGSLSGLFLLAPQPSEAAGPDKIRFNEHIRPLLSNACFQCHGPDDKKRDGDLRLDTREGASKDLGGYAAIVPGHPEKSVLLERIVSHDKDEVMPPPKSKKPRLAQKDVALLRRWIEEGAPYSGHWAFQPLSEEAPPEVVSAPWARNAIDRFISARLAAEGLTPSPEAPKTVLLRRLCLDLTGIPPNPEETAAFVSDPLPDAYDRAVERLLASPHYGERWGRHWLDQARYADSNGYSVDAQRDMWPFRDWVVRALNEDMPFDRFTIEQLAGDLLPSPSKSQLIASAFHRNTMINQEGGTNAEQFRNEAVVDRVNTTGAVWLGLTVGCAQCHTHKYDPITHQEYFKLFAFFNSSTDVNNTGQTIDVLPGEVLGHPKAGVTPARYATALAKVANTKRESAARQKAWIQRLQNTPQNNPQNTQWRTAPILSMVAESGRDHAVEADGFVRLSAGAKPKDAFLVTLSAPSERVEAVRLRVAPDAPKGKQATFTLSEFELLADGIPVPFALALTANEAPKNPAKASIDGDTLTAWVPDPSSAKNGEFEVWFLLAQPLELKNQSLTVRLRQNSGAAFLGKFHVSASENAPLLPPDTAVANSASEAAKRAAQGAKLTGPESIALGKAFALIDIPQALADSELESLRKSANPANLLIMKDQPQPRPTLLHLRGDYLSPDEKLGPLEPNTPQALPSLFPTLSENTFPNRLTLARWLVRADNPLTPRVTVNRVWMHYFGLGLVETENDFGTQGTTPSHPGLLDWLAREFVRNAWSLKQLHRAIVLSATYRQSSNYRPDLAEKDPRNLWLARQNRIRFDAEIVRDAALQASGLLDKTLGGPPVYPPQPEGVYSFTQSAKPWKTSEGAERYRRALYTMFYRSAQHPLTSTFDAPNFSASCTRRFRSNTPLQALMLANDETFFEMAKAAATLLWNSDRVTRAFERFLTRKPEPAELEKSLGFLNQARLSGAEIPTSPSPTPSLNGQSPQEAAAWTALARGLMNTDEFITRE
jgi:Protein of unknown function (DUF1553)/Protein of unknown function (DUF1549)/Planctomycete cytochrome C